MPKMDRELGLKAMDQFPDFANMAGNMISHLNKLTEKALETNKDSNKQTIKGYRKTRENIILKK